jgi:hypothetical protein
VDQDHFDCFVAKEQRDNHRPALFPLFPFVLAVREALTLVTRAPVSVVRRALAKSKRHVRQKSLDFEQSDSHRTHFGSELQASR